MSTRDQAIAAGKRHTDSIVGVAEERGWGRPAEYKRLTLINAAAQAAGRDSVPAPLPFPHSADEAAGWVEQVAHDRLEAGARREAAEDLTVATHRLIAQLGQQLAVELTPRLVDEFAALVTDYAALAGAPRHLSGHESDDELAAHASLLRAAGALTRALHHRMILAQATGEGDDIGSDPTWLVLAAHSGTSLDALSEAVKAHRASMPTTVADWDALAPLGLALAQFGQVPSRIERHGLAMHQRGMAYPDGGIFDRTYGEVEAGMGGRSGQHLSSDSARQFAAAPSVSIATGVEG